MKTCYRCKETKDLESFSKDKTSRDGYGFDCKRCRSEFSKKRRKENPEHYKLQQKRNLLRNFEAIRECQKKHVDKNREKINKKRRDKYQIHGDEIRKTENARRKTPEFREKARNYQRKLRQERKELIEAWTKVHKAIKSGKMIRGMKCEVCGSVRKIEGHHADYAKPLEVQWLCKMCHVKETKK